jgi:hypothetical protein
MDWNVSFRKAGRCLVIEVDGRFVEVERLGRRELRIEVGSVVTEAQDATREHA